MNLKSPCTWGGTGSVFSLFTCLGLLKEPGTKEGLGMCFTQFGKKITLSKITLESLSTHIYIYYIVQTKHRTKPDMFVDSMCFNRKAPDLMGWMRHVCDMEVDGMDHDPRPLSFTNRWVCQHFQGGQDVLGEQTNKTLGRMVQRWCGGSASRDEHFGPVQQELRLSMSPGSSPEHQART